MEYLIGGIAIFICIFLAGFFMKKKYYKETDRLEAWKIDITTRPVLDELQKVKQLNMNGETEERFERWRSIWDEIITVQLPDLEELLFDAEENIDKYRFKKAKAVQTEISTVLANVEERMKKLLEELQELIGSEENNRIEIEDLKEIYRESKKTLLAHRYSFGQMEKSLEMRLEEVSKKFVEFDEETINGNYLQARDIVLSIHEILEKTKRDMQLIPNLLMECQSSLPSQLNELLDGYKGMLAEGYVLDHILVEEEVVTVSQELAETLDKMEESDMEEVQEKVVKWKESIDTVYDLLEKEVLAKHEINQRDREILQMLQSAKKVNSELNHEIAHVQASYHLKDTDLEVVKTLAKQLDQLFKRYELLEYKMEENHTAFSHLSKEMTAVKEVLDMLVAEQAAFSHKLQALRKDELAARDKVQQLKKKVAETIRIISNSNIPGVPEEYKYLLEDAHESIKDVIKKLQEKPLDVPVVQEFLELAVLTVDKVTKSTEELFEMVKLAEYAIQYGNRYRSRYASVDKGLREAEDLFRSFEYKEAFELASATIEKVDPGALKRLEDLLEV
ncbi:septation ring formation regulator EzrA [Niallia endozanthoxylica]|uniref:Septation ring formation regulator EzrA n=1 Tax=Niallia endozanthoxylica TaxID=2036016 RepID=A0A5J5I173_9BACI|nr:septation ring formation regulator EzrA [Niallia endozanthoxylica]KAA9027476.1 septation ring formation regulator EzrA [Niallia endozanthoxylica]